MPNDEVKLPVAVKPLRWEDLTGSGTRFRSYDGLMTYTISRIVQDDVAYFRWARSQGGWSDVFYDADACKAAAQADYEQRILGTLSAIPSTVSGETVPDGWKLVPVEPTTEMADAALAKSRDPLLSTLTNTNATREVVKAAIAASPANPAETQAVEVGE